MTTDIGLARRELIGLAAGAAAIAVSSGARPADLPPLPPDQHNAISGEGVPQVTAVIETTSGRVQGLIEDHVHVFRGIRYGAAPIGPLRWLPARPPTPETVVIDCSNFGAPAMQMSAGAAASPDRDFGMQMSQVFTGPSELKVQNEDCLFVNIWTPATDAAKRPVMVWIHGGGFAYGSGGQPIYCPADLARDHDVVAITLNHRLNIFGFLDLAGAFGPAYASSGSVGMQDLVLALEWVRDNIAKFGGDPGNVTIMGQSGGGAKVAILLSMDSAKGLFHRASIQSGPGLTVGRPDAAAKATAGLLAELGVAAGDIKALQAVPAPTLVAAAFAAQAKQSAGPRLPGMPGGGGFGFSPILDGVAITRDPFTPDGPAVSASVPLMIGSTKDEMTLFTSTAPWFGTMTEDQLKGFVTPLGPKGPALVEAWRRLRPDYSPTYLFTAVISSMFAFGSSITLAERKAAQQGAPVFMYYFTWETPVEHAIWKSPHCIEIPFMLDSYRRVRAFVGPDPEPARMADQLASAWVAFARNGRPDCPEIPRWPPYDAARRATMVLKLESEVVDDPHAEIRKILQS